MAKKDVAVASSTQMALFQDDRPDNIGAGRGSEQVSTSDLVIPRLEIIQDLSPQRKKSEPEYIEGAEEGMMFNTVTKELFADPVIIVPVLFRKEYVIWKKRNAGGGFAGAHASMEDARQALEELENPSQYDIVDTHQNFCLLVRPSSTMDQPSVEEVVLSFSRTKMKVGRQLNSMAKLRGGDRWSSAYKLEVVQESNDKGNFFNYKISPVGYVNPALMALGEKMYDEVKAFKKDVAREPVVEVGEETEY